MTDFSWKIRRIKAMGAKEIVYRCCRFFMLLIEKDRVVKGWQPLPASGVGGNTPLFSCDRQVEQKWHGLFALDPEGLSSLIAGKIDFFGHKKLDVGSPVQWHQDPMTGIEAPADVFGKTLDYHDNNLVGNVKFLWELGRHQHLIPLAEAYAVTGIRKYRDAVVFQVEDWVRENDFGKGIHWCSALEVALRLISWAVIHSFLIFRDKNEGLFAAAVDRKAIERSIFQHAWFIAGFLSRYSSANNHLIGELTGLWVGCLVFDLGADGKKWARKAQRELEIEAAKQVFPDGVNKEQAVYYHLWVLEYLLFAYLTGSRAGQPFSPDFKKTIDSMAEFLSAVTPAGGVPPQIGDADDGFVTRFNSLWPENPYFDVLQAVKVTGHKKFLQEISQKAFWYGIIGGASFSIDDLSDTHLTVPEYPRVFPEGGYGVLGDGHVHLVFNSSSLGYPSIAAHGHADALSFCLAVDGKWWLTDPGTYAYHSDSEWRNYFRSTAAHNTLVVDSQNQSRIGGPFLWLKHAHVEFEGVEQVVNARQKTAGSHTGYPGINHRRKIEYTSSNKNICIVDSVRGKGRHELALYFHFAPGVGVECIENGLWFVSKQKSPVSLSIFVEKNWSWQVLEGSIDPKAGWYSSGLEKKQSVVTLCGQWIGSLPKEIMTVIRVSETGK